MVDANQLFVLLSILSGLTVARLFEHTCRYFYARDRVIMDWLGPGWSALTFLVVVRDWWGNATRSDFASLTFWAYLDELSAPVLVYVIAVLLTPELPANGQLDLRAHYTKGERLDVRVHGIHVPQAAGISVVLAPQDLTTPPNVIRLVFIALIVLVVAIERRWMQVGFWALTTALYFAFAFVTA